MEDRVTNLEHEVQYLKAFAGPGQNQALSANVAEIAALVADLKRQFDRLEQKVEARLDKVDSRLDQMDRRFDGVEGLLAEILRRLPRPATPADN
jgi:DNA anti-recombination protein RmuC